MSDSKQNVTQTQRSSNKGGISNVACLLTLVMSSTKDPVRVPSMNRTYPCRPYACFDEDGKGVDLHDILEEIRCEATECARQASKHLTWKNMVKVSDYDGIKPAEAGRRMGIQLPPGRRQRGRSRFERMAREYAVSQLRSWHERFLACRGESNKYVSAGWKRTADLRPPVSLAPRLALSATDSQYHSISIDGNTTVLRMVVSGRWVNLYFKTPRRFLEEGVRPIAPDIIVDDHGRVMFNWFAEIPVERAEFSERYVVGVDVGRNNAVFSAVVDVTTGDVVEVSGGNRRIKTLENRISRTEHQIRSLHKTGRHEEAAQHREGLVNRRNELAILVGQEVAALSFRYDNALVAVEDLSGIRNTMSHGRWVRGQMVQRSTDMVESNGGRILRVNPAYTSQRCHVCNAQMDMRDSRRPRCLVCKVTWDRDENAAVNIAKRAPHSKACATRKRHASSGRRRNSKGSTTTLRHPLSKGRPTPKAPQNRPQDSHMLEHSKCSRHEKQKGGETTITTCAVGWSSLVKVDVSVPTVGSSYEDVQTTSRTTTPCSATSRDTTSCGNTKV